MLLTLDDDHKNDLVFLKDSSMDVVREFCKISLEFMKKGINQKMFSSAAQKLGVETQVIERSIHGLMWLFSEAAKNKIQPQDFQDSILALGFSEEASKEVVEQFVGYEHDLRDVLSEISPALPHFHQLQWRVDIQVASRSLHHQVEPQIIMKLHTKDGDKDEVTPLQTDPTNLVHLTKSLDQALQELKSAHCRRILRNI